MTNFDATIKNDGDTLALYLKSDKAKMALKSQSQRVQQSFKECGNMLKWSGIHLDYMKALKNFCKSNDLTYSYI